MRFDLRLQYLEEQLGTREDWPCLAFVDESGKLVKVFLGTTWLTGEAAARSVTRAMQKRMPFKAYYFDPEPV